MGSGTRPAQTNFLKKKESQERSQGNEPTNHRMVRRGEGRKGGGNIHLQAFHRICDISCHHLENANRRETTAYVKYAVRSPNFISALFAVHSCTHNPPPPHLGSYTRALLVRQTTSLCDPMVYSQGRSKYFLHSADTATLALLFPLPNFFLSL